MPPLTSLMGRLSLALTLILFCVVVGLVVVFGSGGSQAPATGFGDLAATVEARRTASAPTPTPTPAPSFTPQPTSAHKRIITPMTV